MIGSKSFKEQVKIVPMLSKTPLEHVLRPFFEKTHTYSKHLVLLGVLSTMLSGCSTIQTVVSAQIEAAKADIQTNHDEVVRIKRVRNALLKEDIEKAKALRDTIYASYFRYIATIEIAAAEYPHNPEEALCTIDSTIEKIWDIIDPNDRAMTLIALLKFQLETEKNIPAAKETIEQTENTISFIIDSDFF